MTDEEIQKLIDHVKAKLARGITKEEALRSLQRSGHLDANGNFTPPYQELGKAIEYATKKQRLHGIH